MKPLVLTTLVAVALSACRPAARPAAGPAPAPAPIATPAPAGRADTAAAALLEPPANWQLLDEATDRVPGISALRAERELLAGKAPKRTVVVAVIDAGVDTAHADLRANLWTNAKEVAGNGKDDDRNGYADDGRGWNFIGGRDGKSVGPDTYEVTRLYVRCTGGAASGAVVQTLPVPERTRCDSIVTDFRREKAEAEQTLEQVRTIAQVLARAVPILQQALGTDSLSVERVTALRPRNNQVQQARGFYLQLAANGITPESVEDALKAYESRVEYGLNPSFNPRDIVGDDYANLAQRRYGNADVMGPDAGHGTHVGGIIGAVRANGVGVDGIAPAVRIMSVRAVPDGDERDKDVANAIRYAVDNGAHVINMSFGKAYSPQKGAVDEAVKYADTRGVLIVHAAGNEGEDLARKANYPTATYLSGGRAQNWIEVGASSWRGGDSLVAPFSNYNQTQVDVFAPGVDILSTVPGGGYKRESGTSMAAPVVSGLAATLMAYYPTLTAADVKRIILASATRRPDQMVLRPGSHGGGEKVPFGTLSATGAIVNAYAAIRMADEMSTVRP